MWKLSRKWVLYKLTSDHLEMYLVYSMSNLRNFNQQKVRPERTIAIDKGFSLKTCSVSTVSRRET